MATKTKYKIGFVLDDGLDKTDGVQQYILTLGAYFSTKGHSIHYLVGQTTRTDLDNVHSMSRNMGVKFNGNRMSMPLPASKKQINELLKREAFDVLHVQTPYSPFMGAKVVMCAPTSTAIIGTFHIAPNSSFVQKCTSILGFWVQRSLARFDNMTSVSVAAQDFCKITFGVNSEVIPNPVPYDVFKNGKRLARYSDDKKNILFLGRLVPRKGILTLIEAVSILKERAGLPDFRVIVCGKGPLRDKAESLIKKHQLQDIIEMVGFVSEEEKPDYYASADISVFPSSGGESFGIVLTEAMSSGRAAVLAGDNVGYRSVLGVKPELLFDPRSPKVLANLLEKYLKDDKLTKDTAKWGKEYAKNFDVDLVAKKLLEIYSKALRNKQ